MDNVVDFQKVKERKEQEHFDEVIEESKQLEHALELFGMEAVHDIVEILIDEFECDIHRDPKVVFEIVSIVEHIKSLAYRSMGIEYPLQTITDSLFESSVTDPERLLNFFMTGKDPDENDH